MKRFALAALCAVTVLGGCASDSQRPLARAGKVSPARAQGQTPGEAVWHLRAGLNVAALSCRGKGRKGVAGGYSKLLSRHRSLLAAAYAGEQNRHGKGLDRHLTKVYNRFAYQKDPAAFCQKAAAVAASAVAMDSSTLSGQAPKLLARL